MTMGTNWHAGVVEFLRTRLPSDSPVRPYAKRMVEDTRTLTRLPVAWKHHETKPPQALYIETTNICNANCIFCAYQFQKNFRPGKGVMKDEVFEKALADYKQMLGGNLAGQEINFTPLVGDPLVDPGIIQRIRRAKEEGFQVTFFTNGILLNRIDMDAFLASGLDRFIISTSPFDRESHEKLYRTKKYDALRDGVHRFLKRRAETNTPLRLSLQFRSHIPLREIVQQPDFRQFVLPYLSQEEQDDLYAQVRGFDHWGGQIKPEDLLDGMQIAKAPLVKHRPCRYTFFLMVMYDGQVRACSCRFTGREQSGEDDGLCVGDLQQQSLQEIWAGERLRALRRSFAKKQMPKVCQSCTMYRAI